MLGSNCLENKVFISVVSHGHGEMIEELDCLKKLSNFFQVVIKNNRKDDALLSYVREESIVVLDEDYYQGFGYNNNVVYNYCSENLGMKSDDYFIILNPDLIVSAETVMELINNMTINSSQAATINLYKDDTLEVYDESVRHFPKFGDFLSSLFLGKNNTKIKKAMIHVPTAVDWCAGSFMAFKAETFKKIHGFDIGYFMYCEDIDLCYRLMKSNYKIVFYPSLIGVHKAQHKNRAIFSRHFLWHVKSAFRFLLVKNNLVTNRTNIY